MRRRILLALLAFVSSWVIAGVIQDAHAMKLLGDMTAEEVNAKMEEREIELGYKPAPVVEPEPTPSEPLKFEMYIGAYSYHLSSGDYNENNKLLGVSVGNVVLTTYVNSFDADSYSLTYHWRRQGFQGGTVLPDIEWGVQLGIVSGYEDAYDYTDYCSNGYCPVISPQVTYTGWGRWQPTVILMGKALAFTMRWEY